MRSFEMSSFQQLKREREARSGARPMGSTTKTLRAADTRGERPTRNGPGRAEPGQGSQSKNGHVGDNNRSASTLERQSDAVSANHIQGAVPQTLAENPNIEVRFVDGRGRGLFWMPRDGQTAEPGTSLFRHVPELSILDSRRISKHCYTCFSRADGTTHVSLQRCSGCRVVHYCGTVCQRRGWPSHRPECKALQARTRHRHANGSGTHTQHHLSEIDPGTTVRLMARAAWERSRVGSQVWKDLNTLQGRSLQKSQELEGTIRFVTHFYKGDVFGTGEDETTSTQVRENIESRLGSDVDMDDMRRIAGIVQTNTFVLTSPDLEVLGLALSTAAAKLNHACDANVSVVWPEIVDQAEGTNNDRQNAQTQRLSVVARRQIQPGEEITTNYVDISDPVKLRQEALEARYGFCCSCDLCKTVGEQELKPAGPKKSLADPREVKWCVRDTCTGWLPCPAASPAENGTGSHSSSTARAVIKAKCTRCKEIMPVDIQKHAQLVRLGVRTLREMSADASRGSTTRFPLFRATISQLAQEMPPSAYPLFGLLHQFAGMYIGYAASLGSPSTSPDTSALGGGGGHDISTPVQLEAYDEAIRLHYVALAGMQAGASKKKDGRGSMYPRGHPARAVLLAALGRLLIVPVANDVAKAAAAAAASCTRGASPSCLPNPPALPAPSPQRDALGIAVLQEARQDLRIAFGVERDGGALGSSVRAILDDYADMQAQQRQMLATHQHVEGNAAL